MARAYLNIVKNGLSSGDNTIYTCPSGGQAIILPQELSQFLQKY